MANEAQTGRPTEPEQITVGQLAAQLTKKAPSGEGGQAAATTAATTTTLAPETALATEAPPEGATGTEPDLSQPALTTEELPPDERHPEGNEPDWLKKRMARFTARQTELQQKLAAAEQRAEEAAAKLAEAEKKTTAETPNKAWNHVEQGLQQQLAQKRAMLRWADENPDGATIPDDKGGEVTYTADQVRAIKYSALEDVADLRSQLRDHQASLAQAKAQWEAEAVKAYPALADPNSQDSRDVETILQKLPWLRDVPDARLSLADMLAGARARKAKGNGTATTTTATRVAAPGGGAAPQRTIEAAPNKKVQEADAAFQQTGRVSDLARRFSAQRQ